MSNYYLNTIDIINEGRENTFHDENNIELHSLLLDKVYNGNYFLVHYNIF